MVVHPLRRMLKRRCALPDLNIFEVLRGNVTCRGSSLGVGKLVGECEARASRERKPSGQQARRAVHGLSLPLAPTGLLAMNWAMIFANSPP